MKRPSIAIVGPGRLGTALAERLFESGYSISEIVTRDQQVSMARARKLARKLKARASSIRNARLEARVIWLCVPDGDIAQAASDLSHLEWKGKIAIHSSGVLTSDVLQSLRERGAAVASVHPLMTFVRGSVPKLANVPFAVEGDSTGLRCAAEIVRNLGGEAVHIKKQEKVAYHAFATMICPLLISLLAASEEIALLARISRTQARRRIMPIIQQTLVNYAKHGAAKSFSGPIVRGDEGTIRQHLLILAKSPLIIGAYAALARAALEYLPHRNRAKIAELLDELSLSGTVR